MSDDEISKLDLKPRTSYVPSCLSKFVTSFAHFALMFAKKRGTVTREFFDVGKSLRTWVRIAAHLMLKAATLPKAYPWLLPNRYMEWPLETLFGQFRQSHNGKLGTRDVSVQVTKHLTN